jgi:hypothetical protein
MDLDIINRRVDQALADNRRAENFIIAMAIGIFILGLATVVVAYWRINPYIGSAAIILEGLLYWPIKEILKLRRDNLILQAFPMLVAALPPADLAKELVRTLDFIRRG